MLSWRKSWNGSSLWCGAEHQTATITTATLADWSTPRPSALPDLGPGIEGQPRQALELALQAMAADPTLQALVLYSFGEACGYGSRARGNAQPESDLDLLVVEHTPTWKARRKWPAGGVTSSRCNSCPCRWI